jgi:prophage maintenance system killer protein
VFLDLNGYAIDVSDDAIVNTIMAVASGVMGEEQLAKWFRSVIR